MEKRLYIFFVILLLTTLCGAGGLWYGYTKLISLKANEMRLAQEISTQDAERQKLTTINAAFEKIKAEEGGIQGFLYRTNEEDWIRFVTEMESLARAAEVSANVTVSDFSENEGKPFEVDVRITRGRWEQMHNYLELLNAFPGRIVVDRFQLRGEGTPQNARTDANWTGSFNFKLISVQRSQ